MPDLEMTAIDFYARHAVIDLPAGCCVRLLIVAACLELHISSASEIIPPFAFGSESSLWGWDRDGGLALWRVARVFSALRCDPELDEAYKGFDGHFE